MFSSFLLCRIIDIACCFAMVLISLKVCLIVFNDIFSFSPKIFIDGMCVVALVLVVMTINGCTFYPLLVMFSISDRYFLVFLLMVSGKNLSLQYANSINLNLRLFLRIFGGFSWYGSPLTYMISDLNLALQWHL